MQHQDSASLLNENELIQLAELAGVRVQPEILRILIQLLGMNINPTDLYMVFRNICFRHSLHRSRPEGSRRRSHSRRLSQTLEKVVKPHE